MLQFDTEHIAVCYYLHMPIGMLGICHLLFMCNCVRKNFVRDISGMGWCRAMKFGRMVDLGGQQVFSPFGEFLAQGLARQGQKVKNFGNAHLVDRLRNRAEIWQDGRPGLVARLLPFWLTLAQGLSPRSKSEKLW